MTLHSAIFLRRLLLADGAISGITGLVMLAGSNVLGTFLDLPVPLLRYSGLVLLPFAAMVLYFARADDLTSSRVWTVLLMNASWVAGSMLVLLSGWIAPNGFGVTFVVVQALAVAALAELQYRALRRSTRGAMVSV